MFIRVLGECLYVILFVDENINVKILLLKGVEIELGGFDVNC